jgi:hypothetical protein
MVARYGLQLAGGWRRVFVISVALALYLNVFVAVVQSFLKVPVLKALAPTQKEPPFMVAQLVVLLIFAGLNHFGGEAVPRRAGPQGLIALNSSLSTQVAA